MIHNIYFKCLNIIEVLNLIKQLPIDSSIEEIDKLISDAYHKDSQEQISEVLSAIAKTHQDKPSIANRETSILTCEGRVTFSYPYNPLNNVASLIYEKLGNKKGDFRSTPEARRIISEASSLLGSYEEAASFLNKNNHLKVSLTSMKQITNTVIERTNTAWEKDLLKIETLVLPTKKIPKNARYVGLTLVIGIDGTCAPCVNTDTTGRKGKIDDEAKTREIKVLTIAIYSYVNKDGKPIINKGDMMYFASDCNSSEFETIVNILARRKGIGNIKRVQFIGDGAMWIQKIWEHAFKNCGAFRTLDFVHACSYLHTLLEALISEKYLSKEYKKYKTKLKNWGGFNLIKKLEKQFKGEIPNLPEEARKAFEYLKERAWMMNYKKQKKEGYYIGSGFVESACKTLVAARCKLAGMHWRHKNAAGIALLRATLKSNYKLAV